MAPHVVHGARSLSKIQPCRKRAGEICLGASDGVFKLQPLRQPACDGAGERAAGAVGIGGMYARSVKLAGAVALLGVCQHVVGVVRAVSAFYQDGAAQFVRQLNCCELLVLGRGNLPA